MGGSYSSLRCGVGICSVDLKLDNLKEVMKVGQRGGKAEGEEGFEDERWSDLEKGDRIWGKCWEVWR